MFVDELTLHVRAGHGGEGLIHFARRKFQPFGGPDGGDGGRGGDVVLVGSRSVDSLEALRYFKAEAEDGKPGGKNLKAGSDSPPLEIAAAPGTLALLADSGYELGAVKATGEKLTLAAGGKGGRGNPHFATATNRAPKRSQDGEPGEECDIELRYRIYAETVLIEPATLTENLVLPLLLERDVLEVDFELYRRKPRWVRTQHEYKLYDAGYLGLDYDAEAKAVVIHGPHVYWGRRIFINLLPVEDAATAWAALQPWLLSVELRHAERITCCARAKLFTPWQLEVENGSAQVECVVAASADELLAAFQAQLTGGTVD